MKCIKCHNTLHAETGEFPMTINGKTIKVINAPVLHCKNCNSVIISDEVKEKAKEFSVNDDAIVLIHDGVRQIGRAHV